MRDKVTFTYDTKEKNDVSKTVSIDFFSSVEECGDSLLVEFYDQSENLQSKYCKSIQFHN
jgi:hypothetical protein